ncbi:hypothetical protein HELRODRAFT_174894 [Helobdella robusta]|uniref:Protein kinase domain-containing protein n=1 Tax=Helobdella robusta TaxID=6412 RepID=T1F8L1_HELRO|nr:hypothetical protein HELRODRAFT_174894 [Helobdella robusta]ESO01339.1 hypothetical protein HELRODRAFT_174894 [Helobdella robusta]
MTMKVRGSENFVWFTDLKLGDGFNGPSYKCRHKKSGEEFVSKDLKYDLVDRNQLLELNHKNILKVVELTKDTKSFKDILIVEFCSENSLQDVLSIPDNYFGLDEESLLALGNDVIEGLHHLHEKKLIPSNFHLKTTTILCSKKKNGSLQFKVSDYYFKHFKDDMYFTSTVKTQLKNVSILLWSLGCLMCHAINGKSPFFELDSSLGKVTELLKQRKSNDLHVVKKHQNHPFEWSNTFLITCRISFQLQLTYQQFISNCFKPGNSLPLKESHRLEFVGQKFEVFNVNDYLVASRYLSNSSVLDLKLKEKCNKNTVLVYNRNILSDSSTFNFSHGTLMNDPIVMVTKKQELKFPNLLIAEMKSIHSSLLQLAKTTTDCDMEMNIEIARKYSSFAILCLRLHSDLERCKEILYKTMCAFKSLALEKYDLLYFKFHLLDKNRIKLNLNDFNVNEQFHLVEKKLKSLKRDILNITTVITTNKSRFYTDSIVNCKTKQCNGTINECVEQTMLTYKKFLDEKDKNLTHNDKQILKYDRIKLNESAHRAFKIIYEHCTMEATGTQKVFIMWFNDQQNGYDNFFGQQTVFDQIEIMIKDLKTLLNSTKKSHSDSLPDLYLMSFTRQLFEIKLEAINERSETIKNINKYLEAKPNVHDIFDTVDQL